MLKNTGRNPTASVLKEAKRIASLPEHVLRGHPSAVLSDKSKLIYINTYGQLPEFSVDMPLTCRDCGKEKSGKLRIRNGTVKRRRAISMPVLSDVTIAAWPVKEKMPEYEQPGQLKCNPKGNEFYIGLRSCRFG